MLLVVSVPLVKHRGVKPSIYLCLFLRIFLFLAHPTIGFSFLARVGVVKDALRIVSPGQTAELYPLQYIRQRAEVVCLHETHCHPVWATATQTICKIFTLLRETTHWMEIGTEGKKQAVSTVNLPLFICKCVCVCAQQLWLTLQCHSAIFREFVWVEKDRGGCIQGVLHIQHILVLKAFVVKVEISSKAQETGSISHLHLVYLVIGAVFFNLCSARLLFQTSSLFCKGSCIWDSHRDQWGAGGTGLGQHIPPGTAWSVCSAPRQRPEIQIESANHDIWSCFR